MSGVLRARAPAVLLSMGLAACAADPGEATVAEITVVGEVVLRASGDPRFIEISEQEALTQPPSLWGDGDRWAAIDPRARSVLLSWHGDGAPRRLGRAGQGPGDFQRPSSLVVQGSEVWISDPARGSVSVWDAEEGALVEDRRTPEGLDAFRSFALLESGRIVFPTPPSDSILLRLEDRAELPGWPRRRSVHSAPIGVDFVASGTGLLVGLNNQDGELLVGDASGVFSYALALPDEVVRPTLDLLALGVEVHQLSAIVRSGACFLVGSTAGIQELCA